MTTKLNHALKLAEMGFKVFPLAPNSKIPPKEMKDFPNKATNDKNQIKEWWSNGHADANIGISTNGYLAVDVDNKGVKKGDEELLRLEINEGLVLPATFEQTTPTGGRHIVYKTTTAFKNSVSKLGPGLDTRAERGYIVGAGSVIGGRAYTQNGRGVVQAPEGLVSRLHRFTPKPNDGPKQGAYRVNQENALERARFYLENEAPIAIQGSGGNQTTYTVAARIKDFGVSQEDCFYLMGSGSWNSRCEPEWGADELALIVRNAYNYGEKPQGVDSPEAVFSVIPTEDTNKPKTKGLYGEKCKDVEPNFNQHFLVDKYLSPNAMSVVYGESNSGKTFFCLDLALHISLGQTWNNKKTEKGLVIYVAAEGGWGIRKRIKAFRKYHNLEGVDVPFVLVPCAVDLLNPKAHVQELITLINYYESEFNQKAELVIIDTLARALGGGNENAPNDMGSFVKNIDHIRQATKAHLMVIHHSGKDVAKGARGHSSLRGATDTEIEISEMTAKTTKQRDMEFSQAIGFKLEQLEVGTQPNGEPVYSCVVVPSNTSATKDFSKEALDVSTLAGKGYKALQNALDWKPQPAPNDLDLDPEKMVVSLEDWREAFYELAYPGQQTKRTWRVAFVRMVEKLVASGHVKKTDIWAWIE